MACKITANFTPLSLFYPRVSCLSVVHRRRRSLPEGYWASFAAKLMAPLFMAASAPDTQRFRREFP